MVNATENVENDKSLISPFGLIAEKVGMTRIFNTDGVSIPVTVLDVSNNRISQIKTTEKDGYDAVQIAFGKAKQNKLKKSIAGHCAKSGVEASRVFKELRLNKTNKSLSLGSNLSVSGFNVGDLVNVTGVTKGKGFAGAIKRHGFSSQRTTHGNSVSHRAPGSIGMCQDPGKVFKGKRMAGHLGVVRQTTLNLEVVKIYEEKNLLLLKGSVPGNNGAKLVVRSSLRSSMSGN